MRRKTGRCSAALRFVPLRWADGSAECVVALVASDDSPEPLPADAAHTDDESRQLHLELQRLSDRVRLRHRVTGVLGVTPAARRAAAQAELAAATRANVLLLGPPGSGCVHLAEAIHWASAQRPGPIVPLDCSVLDADLVQSTFRSAVAECEPGTLLFVDADRIPVESQALLAAALAGRGFRWRTMATAAAPLADLRLTGNFEKTSPRY